VRDVEVVLVIARFFLVLVVKEEIDIRFADIHLCTGKYALTVFDQAACMIGVRVGDQDIGDVLRPDTLRRQAFNQPPAFVGAKELTEPVSTRILWPGIAI
jgi:hypothetical protein